MMGAGKAWLVAAVALALLLIVLTFPMRLALAWADADDAGIAAREVRGSIWSGELVEARLGALPPGPVKASLSPLALLGGDVDLGFAHRDERQIGTAALRETTCPYGQIFGFAISIK